MLFARWSSHVVGVIMSSEVIAIRGSIMTEAAATLHVPDHESALYKYERKGDPWESHLDRSMRLFDLFSILAIFREDSRLDVDDSVSREAFLPAASNGPLLLSSEAITAGRPWEQDPTARKRRKFMTARIRVFGR